MDINNVCENIKFYKCGIVTTIICILLRIYILV